MISRSLAVDLPSHVGEPVRIAGWVQRRRQLKSVTFLVVRDRSGLAQVVLPPEADAPGEESVVEVLGVATANPQAPGGVEVAEARVEVLAEAQPPPFDLYRPTLPVGLPVLLDHAPVALRHPELRRRFAVAAASVAGFRSVLDGLGFTETHTPKLVGTATESGANVFDVDFFGRRAHLAQSPQLYKQTLVGVFERVYEVGPVFRAEPHDTTRHLAQYTSLDAELGFIRDHRDVMVLLTQVIAGMLAAASELTEVPISPPEIPAVHFLEAQELLAEHTDEDPRGEPDLAPAHERWLSEWALREHGSDFLFVTGYPMSKRPFYTHPDPERPDSSNSFDLLFRGVELVTGGQRLHRHADYLAVLDDPEPYASYLEAFAHGMPPHGGFAIGLERWTARLLGLRNVRETTLFPRDLNRLAP
ncbi:aspartate--tRNA(Asn) ligase [Actinokineospora pegani]|uniref:aspartate--tRNA(Asn) ligase n=1 Tax=Actinokineospora pegani TaxID=2654637 RepID=UPI0018D2764B|nr:aspartate--tRNA(Asn) ligase [Actinokineospora pegani]